MLNRLLAGAIAAVTATIVTPILASPAVASPAVAFATPGSAGPSPFGAANCAGMRAGAMKTTRFTSSTARTGAVTAQFTIVCTGARAVPKVYLALPRTIRGGNFSQYTAGGASPGTDVVTRYSRIRLDPVPVRLWPLTFRANIADQRYSWSTGSLCHSTALGCTGDRLVRSMPYGVAFDCRGGGAATGRANIDLRGTPFAVASMFVKQGTAPIGSTTWDSPQVVNLTGGGYCGWNAPGAMFNPYNDNPKDDANNGWDLRLTLLH